MNTLGTILRWTIVALAWIGAMHVGFAAEGIRIVEDGSPRAKILLADDASVQTRAAAELLADYVRQSTRAALPIIQEEDSASAERPITIHVGRGKYVDRLDLPLAGLDDDGYVMRAVDARNIVIVDGFAPDEEVHLDDLAMIRVD